MIGSKLGEFFIQKNMIDPTRVELALASQVTSGGRIGTNLVELGYLTLDQVANALGWQHGVPVATMEVFEGISSAVLGAVPRELCARYNVIPLRVVGSVLHVAMMDPQHLTLVDRLGAAVGMPIQAYAAPQLRVLYYLERHYGIRRPERFLRIPLPEEPVERDRRSYLAPTMDPADRTSGTMRESVEARARPRNGRTGLELAAAAGPKREKMDSVELDIGVEESIPELEIEVDFAAEERPIVEQLHRVGMQSLDQAIARLEGARSRQALIKQMIHPILPETTLNLLTLVRGDVTIALGAWGTDMKPASVRSLVLPLGIESLFSRAFQQRTVVRAMASTCRLQRMIAVFFRSATPREACITPICVDGKVVNLICTHSEGPFSDNAVAVLKALAEHAAEAYKRLISASTSETLRPG